MLKKKIFFYIGDLVKSKTIKKKHIGIILSSNIKNLGSIKENEKDVEIKIYRVLFFSKKKSQFILCLENVLEKYYDI